MTSHTETESERQEGLEQTRERGRMAVIEAGRIAMRYFRQTFHHWEKTPGQIVTDADIAVDRYLKGALTGRTPAEGWLSEETPDDRERLKRRRVWVVDPIDGTRSFAAGVPEFTVSVALLEDDRPVLGYVLNPANGDFFEAVAGGGATLNGQPLHTTLRDSLEGARIVVSASENRRRKFADYLPGAELATIGSLAYKLCLVAAARYDGYLTWRRTHDWDIAAAILVLKEAGARVSHPDGGSILLNRERPWHEGVVAAGPPLHRAILATTAEAHARLLAG